MTSNFRSLHPQLHDLLLEAFGKTELLKAWKKVNEMASGHVYKEGKNWYTSIRCNGQRRAQDDRPEPCHCRARAAKAAWRNGFE